MSIKPKIIGIAIVIGMAIAVIPAQAFYSPVISNQIAAIRQHVFTARQLNGTGSPRHGIQKLFDDDTIAKLNEADDERRRKGEVTGLSGEFHQYRDLAKSEIAKDEFKNYGQGFLLMFNRLNGQWINSCLRNDLFALEELRDAVLREALISSLKLNRESAAILWNDYKDIRAMLELLKDYYGNANPEKKLAASPIFFPSGEPDYYQWNCPEGGFWGEYGRAFDDLKRSWDTLSTVLQFRTLGQTAYGSQWGSIRAMARARARVRASEWIRANQITLSLRGEEGGGATSIRDLYRSEGIGSIFKTQWEIAKAIIGPITPLFDPDFYETVGEAIGVGFGANPEILRDNYCVFYKGEGQWRPCNEEETERFDDGKCPECRNQYENWTPLTLSEDLQSRLKEKERELIQTETTLQFNLEFSSLADSSMEDIEDVLRNINAEIRRGSEQFGDEAGQALPTLCRDVRAILEKQCPGKNIGTLPGCR